MISTQMYPTSAGPGPRFRVGDWVRVVYNDDGTGEYVGMVAQIIGVKPHEKYCYTLSSCSTGFGDHELALEHRTMNSVSSPLYVGMDTGYNYGLNSVTISDKRIGDNFSMEKMRVVMDEVLGPSKPSKPKPLTAARKIYWNRVRRNIHK